MDMPSLSELEMDADEGLGDDYMQVLADAAAAAATAQPADLNMLESVFDADDLLEVLDGLTAPAEEEAGAVEEALAHFIADEEAEAAAGEAVGAPEELRDIEADADEEFDLAVLQPVLEPRVVLQRCDIDARTIKDRKILAIIKYCEGHLDRLQNSSKGLVRQEVLQHLRLLDLPVTDGQLDALLKAIWAGNRAHLQRLSLVPTLLR